MPRTFLTASLLALLVASCGERSEEPTIIAAEETAPPPVSTDPAPVEAAPVRAEITLGQFETDVTDLAAWEVQPFGFQSRIFAANGAAGITSIRADGGDAVTIDVDPPATKLAAVDAGEDEALLVTFAVDGTVEARDMDDLSAAPRRLTRLPSPRDLCVLDDAVIAVSGSGATVVLGETVLPLTDVPTDTIGCSVVGQDIYFQSPNGWDRLTAQGLEPTPLVGAATVLVAAGDEVFAVGPDGLSGELKVNELSLQLRTPGGDELRPLMVKPAYGNFGGVLRDGALIVLDEQRNLYLFGWSAIANALGLPPRLETLRPREAGPAFEGPALPEPRDSSLRIEREDGFRPAPLEEDELPQPPGQ